MFSFKLVVSDLFLIYIPSLVLRNISRSLYSSAFFHDSFPSQRSSTNNENSKTWPICWKFFPSEYLVSIMRNTGVSADQCLSFYHWKNPKKTIASLCFFASCVLVSVLTDMAFCMQIVWFIVGGAFFLCWPVSSHYPNYRYLVSPFKWVLWGIPTNSEFAFLYLRRQAQINREQLIQKKVEESHFRELANPAVEEYSGCMITVPKIKVEGSASEDEDNDDDDDEGWYSACSTTSVLEASDIRSFRCQSHKVIGRLVIYSKGVRFVRSRLPKKELWRRDYLDLAELRKVEGSTVSKLASLSPDQLEIKCIDGIKLHLEGMKERDEAFNTIIAYSGLQWQSLQVLSNTKAQP